MAKVETIELGSKENTMWSRGKALRIRKLVVERRENGGVVITGESQKPSRTDPPLRLELDRAGTERLRGALQGERRRAKNDVASW